VGWIMLGRLAVTAGGRWSTTVGWLDSDCVGGRVECDALTGIGVMDTI